MQKDYKNLSLTVIRKDKHHELKKALTHYSYYSNTKEAENSVSSKYIFLGMYAFKGKVAELMRKYIPLNGKQLQHYLGNVFKNNQLEHIYNKYYLARLVRYAGGFPIEKHHHVFVYALLGFVFEHSNEQDLLRFIYQNFLAKTEHLLPTKPKNKDMWSQCLFLSKMYYNTEPVLKLEKLNDVFCASVCINNKTIAKHQSKSQQYARKKVVKTALLHIAEQQALLWANNPIAQEVAQMLKKRNAEKEAKEKAEKQKPKPKNAKNSKRN